MPESVEKGLKESLDGRCLRSALERRQSRDDFVERRELLDPFFVLHCEYRNVPLARIVNGRLQKLGLLR